MIRASVIGAGWYAAEVHIPTLAARKDVVLDGVCRLGTEALERVRRHFGFAFASEDHRAVLARRPDVAVVASPHHLHWRHAADALDAGCHVLCEKPMTLDAAQAWDLVRRAERAGRTLLVANGFHYLPHVAAVRDLVLGGAVGRIEHLACTFISATRPVFVGDEGFARWRTSFFRPDRATWQDPAQGGGFLFGQMSHAVALALWLTGLQPHSVAAHLAPDDVDLADAASVRFACGAVGTFSGAAAMPEGQRAALSLLLAGTEGMLEMALHADRLEVFRADGRQVSLPVAAGDWAYRCDGPANALVELAQGRGENLSPGTVGALTVATLCAMRESQGAAKEVALA